MDAIDNYLEEEVVESGEAEDLETFYDECYEEVVDKQDIRDLWETFMEHLAKTSIENQKEYWNSFRTKKS